MSCRGSSRCCRSGSGGFAIRPDTDADYSAGSAGDLQRTRVHIDDNASVYAYDNATLSAETDGGYIEVAGEAEAWGVLADFLKNVAITAPVLVASQTGFSALDRDMIAFASQFGSLILPAVVPAVAWVLTHRAFLERMRAARGGG